MTGRGRNTQLSINELPRKARRNYEDGKTGKKGGFEGLLFR